MPSIQVGVPCSHSAGQSRSNIAYRLWLDLVGAVLDKSEPTIDKEVGAVRERRGLAREVKRRAYVSRQQSLRTTTKYVALPAISSLLPGLPIGRRW